MKYKMKFVKPNCETNHTSLFIAILWWHFKWSLSNFLYCAIFMVLGVGLGKQLTLIMLDMIIIGRGLNMGVVGEDDVLNLQLQRRKISNELQHTQKDPFKTHTSLRDKCNT